MVEFVIYVDQEPPISMENMKIGIDMEMDIFVRNVEVLR